MFLLLVLKTFGEIFIICSLMDTDKSSCEGIRYIPDMTADRLQSEEISELEIKITQYLTRVDNLKQQRKDNLRLPQQEKNRLLEEIKVLRNKVNNKLDEMEQTLVNKVETKLGIRARDLSKDLDVINNEQALLEKRCKSLQGAKCGNNSERFVQLKMGQSLVQEHELLFNCIRAGFKAVNLQVLPNTNIMTLLQTDGAALGSISEILIPKSTTYDRSVYVGLPSDKVICFISDICFTLNGNIYIADNQNGIKKLDESYTVTEHFDLPYHPWGLCEVDNKRLAVTKLTEKKVQILSQNLMSLRDSFSVGDYCRGIVCHNGQLYVCCGGSGDEGPSTGRIEVYSIGGELLRVYYQGASYILHVHVSKRGDLLISNNDNKCLVKLRMHDYSVSNMQVKALCTPTGIIRLSENLLCVAGLHSNNIVMISEDGEHQQELLTENDGISNPMALCFDRQHSRLIVSSYESDCINIFKVTT